MGTDDEREHPDGPWWALGVWGAACGVGGVVAVYASRHVEGLLRIVLTVVGLLLTIAGGWGLLWFIGIAGILGLIRSKDPARMLWIVIVLVVLVSYVVVLYLVLRS
jgi:hypothetical protein